MMTEIAPLWGIKVTVDAVANGFIVSCVSHGNSEIASMGNCIAPTFDEALLTAIAYYNAYLPGLPKYNRWPGACCDGSDPQCCRLEEITMKKEKRIEILTEQLEKARECQESISPDDFLAFERLNRIIVDMLYHLAREGENEGQGQNNQGWAV